jgi:hypothetical protein
MREMAKRKYYAMPQERLQFIEERRQLVAETEMDNSGGV